MYQRIMKASTLGMCIFMYGFMPSLNHVYDGHKLLPKVARANHMYGPHWIPPYDLSTPEKRWLVYWCAAFLV